jgi:flagellar hook-associated protein 3 FlgL
MLDPIDSSSQQFLVAMDGLNKRLDQAEQQISSGLKIQTASDAPDQISQLLQVRNSIAQNQQLQNNLASYKLEEDTAANALQNASSVIDNVKSAAATAVNGTLSPTMQANLVQEIDGYLQDMVGIANTQVNDRYIFSGDSDQTQPYALDPTQSTGVSVYAGTTSSRQAQGADGSSFSLSLSGQDIFDSSNPGESIFGALASLRDALTNNDSAALQASMSNLQTAQDHLQSEEAFYGTAQTRISQATSLATTQGNQFQDQLSSIQDADITSSILELQDAEFQRSAALSARAKVPPTSLFSYIGSASS